MSDRWRGRAILFLLCLGGSLFYLIVIVSLGLLDDARFGIVFILLLVLSAVVALSVKEPDYWARGPKDGEER